MTRKGNFLDAVEELLADIENWSDEHDGQDPFGLNCWCDGNRARPPIANHSLICRIRKELAMCEAATSALQQEVDNEVRQFIKGNILCE